MKKKLSFQDYLESSYSLIKQLSGLDLKLIERKEVSTYLKQTIEASKKNVSFFTNPKGADFNVSPDSEAAYMFLNKNYGMCIYSHQDATTQLYQRIIDEKQFGFDYHKFYFQKIQANKFNW